jgi:hypothetical protein
MLQTVDGLDVYVVDFDTMPELPITWNTLAEKPYAKALDDAIRSNIITEPGKYGIALVPYSPHHHIRYAIYAIQE